MSTTAPRCAGRDRLEPLRILRFRASRWSPRVLHVNEPGPGGAAVEAAARSAPGRPKAEPRSPARRPGARSDVPRDVGLDPQVALGLQSSASGTVTRSASCVGPVPRGSSRISASMSLGAITCPIYPSSEAGQAGYIINNVQAKAIVVENLQQATKVEKVRAECPTLEKIMVIDERGRCPPARSARPHLRAGDAEPGQEPRVGGSAGAGFGATGWPRSSTPRARPRTQGASCSPTATSSTTSRRQPGRRLQPGPTSSSRCCPCQSQLTERAAGMVVPLGRGLHDRVRGAGDRAPAGEHGRGAPDGHGGGAPPLRAPVRARAVDRRGGVPLRQRIFGWAAGLGEKQYQNHLDGDADSMWLRSSCGSPKRLVFGQIRARTGGRVRLLRLRRRPLSREMGEFFYAMGMLILEGYGLTETAPLAVHQPAGDFVFGHRGRPVAGDEVRSTRRRARSCPRPAGDAGLPRPARRRRPR